MKAFQSHSALSSDFQAAPLHGDCWLLVYIAINTLELGVGVGRIKYNRESQNTTRLFTEILKCCLDCCKALVNFRVLKKLVLAIFSFMEERICVDFFVFVDVFTFDSEHVSFHHCICHCSVRMSLLHYLLSFLTFKNSGSFF